MKGLLLKDFYTIKSSIISLLITFMVIGFGISFFVVPQVLIIIATTVLGMSVITIFNFDKKSGWLKTSITFPTKKSSIISCKYLIYSFVSIIGIFFGIGFSTAISLIIKDTSFSFLPTFVYLSVIMTFFSGSILLPCFYLLDEEKSMIGAMVSYPLGAVSYTHLNLYGSAHRVISTICRITQESWISTKNSTMISRLEKLFPLTHWIVMVLQQLFPRWPSVMHSA